MHVKIDGSFLRKNHYFGTLTLSLSIYMYICISAMVTLGTLASIFFQAK